MKKTDINKYNIKDIMNDKVYKSSISGKSKFAVVGKFFVVVLCIFFIALITTLTTVFIYLFSNNSQLINLDLRSLKIDLTSFIYVNDENDNPVQYHEVYSGESRVWVDYGEIPQAMKNAVVAIEDKRFYQHHGVDWLRTGGAALNFMKGSPSYGGSTITQQLIKNLTQKSDVSIIRKVTEIVTAIMFENKYTKDEILETYLNVVNFGSNCNGVEAASLRYYKKHISECSLVECAAIAGITQNPSMYDPLLNPDKNKARRNIVLSQMKEQGFISEQEYEDALKESENLIFAGAQSENDDEENTANVNDWYTEAMLNDVANDLSTSMNIDRSTALYMVMHNGFKIYSAMDTTAQSIAEEIMCNNSDVMPENKNIQTGYVMMGYDGRVLASIGQRGKKTANLLWDCATGAKRQPGSTFKPLGVYAPALEYKLINYSTLIKDAPLTGIPGTEGEWPPNWYGYYKGSLTTQKALEISANAPAAQVLDKLTVDESFKYVTEKFGITTLNKAEDSTYSAMATGGGYNGVTVREMVAAYQTFGNGGIYNRPYTYFYVEDSTGKVVLDNRDKTGTRAISSSTSTIMRRLLEKVVTGPQGTGVAAKIPGFDMYAKTGTTDGNANSWFIGGTPYAVAGIWTGYETPTNMTSTESAYAIRIWRAIMMKYLDGKKSINFEDDDNVVSYPYFSDTGYLASYSGVGTDTGYYTNDNLPKRSDKAPVSYNSEKQKENSSSDSKVSTYSSSEESDTSSQQSSYESSSQTSSQPSSIPSSSQSPSSAPSSAPSSIPSSVPSSAPSSVPSTPEIS